MVCVVRFLLCVLCVCVCVFCGVLLFVSVVVCYCLLLCEGGVDVVGVVTPLVRGVAQVLHGDQVVELSGQLEVQEVEGREEDREGQVEVEEGKGELKEKRT